MTRRSPVCAGLLGLAVLLVACASPASVGGPSAESPALPAAKKRIVAAAQGDLFTVSSFISGGGLGTTQPGLGETSRLLAVGLSIDNGGTLEARLAQAVPSTENGLWVVQPDGRMTTTWKLRPNALWHDGTPVTAEDFVFTFQVMSDRDIPVSHPAILSFVEKVEAADPQTVSATWKSTYIDADKLGSTLVVMAPHLLREAYETNKPSFTSHSYWNRDFVGTGPYKLKDWQQGSHVIVEANDQYVLGRPIVDEIEVRAVLDPKVLVANLLSGDIELTFSREISIEQANAVRDQWKDGVFAIEFAANSTYLGPQHVAERQNPRLVGNVRFRQALYHALDRQLLVDSITGGLTKVSHSGLPAEDPTYEPLKNREVRYEFDQRKALQILEELGLTKLPGGGFREANGERLAPIEVTSSTTEIYIKTAFSAAGLWKEFGLDTQPTTVPEARESDLEFRASFPGFEAVASGSPYTSYGDIRESQIRTRANNFRGSNRSGYSNPELTNLWDRYIVTIPMSQRLQILGDIVQHMTSNVVLMYLMYSSQPLAISNRLVNVTAAKATSNAHEWDLHL